MDNKKIKVLNVIWSMGAGGAQQVVLNYLRDFQGDSEIDFVLCVYNVPTSSKYDQEIEEKNYNVFYLNNPHTKIQIPYVKRWFQRRVAKKAWLKAISQYNPDIIHVHISELLVQTLEPVCKCNVPVRFDTLHSNPYRNKGKVRRTIKKAFHQEHFIPVCVTSEQVNHAKDWYDISSCEVVHNGIDIKAIKDRIISKQNARELYGIEKDAFVILGIGRFNKIKRFDFLIRIFSELKETEDKARLYFAGDGKEARNLKKLTKKLGLEKSVHFLGIQKSVVELFCAADVLAVTSETESSSLVAIEAQMSGLRCVLSEGVPRESILLPHTKRMKKKATINDWVTALLDEGGEEQPVCCEDDYEVHNISRKMKDIYLKYYTMYTKGGSDYAN